jgi:dTMP kinase
MPCPRRFVSIEGVDGAGKSTHLDFIAETLARHGHDVLTTREPGGTQLGERLREVLLAQPMMPMTELMLMFAARHEHVETVILPALRAGRTVLTDRFTDSSRAYQSAGKGVHPNVLWNLETLTCPISPALTFIFDVPPEVARSRMQGRELDRFESEGEDFHARVRDAYRDLAHSEPERVRLIDANRPVGAIRSDLAAHLAEFAGQFPRSSTRRQRAA